MSLARANEAMLVEGDTSHLSFLSDKLEESESVIKPLNDAIRGFSKAINETMRKEAIADVTKCTDDIATFLEEFESSVDVDPEHAQKIAKEFAYEYDEMSRLLKSNDSKKVKKSVKKWCRTYT